MDVGKELTKAKKAKEEKDEKKKAVTGAICPQCNAIFIHKRAMSVYKCNSCGYMRPAQDADAHQDLFPVKRA